MMLLRAWSFPALPRLRAGSFSRRLTAAKRHARPGRRAGFVACGMDVRERRRSLRSCVLECDRSAPELEFREVREIELDALFRGADPDPILRNAALAH